MEDRISKYLYLELSNRPQEAYANERVPEVLELPDAEATFRRMTPVTKERQIGEEGSPLWNLWVGHEQLDILYVNTFTRIGERMTSQLNPDGSRSF